MGLDHRSEHLVAAIAGAQHGVVSGRQMGWAGVSGRTVGRWLVRGRIFRAGWTGYAVVPSLDDRARAQAALLGAGADRHLEREPPPRFDGRDVSRATGTDGEVVLSHWTALRLQRVCTRALGHPHVTVLRPRSCPRAAGVRGHRVRHLDAADVTVVDGMPTTTVARALVDVAPTTDARRLRRLVREAQFLGLLHDDVLAGLAARLVGHPGVAALAASDPDLPLRLRGDSPLAGDLAVFLENETALGPWSAQYPVPVPGRTYHLDFARPDLALCVEADGSGAHTQSRGRTSDARRDATLLSGDWLTVRVTQDRLLREAVDLRDTLHAIARRRGWTGPPPGWRPRSAT